MSSNAALLQVLQHADLAVRVVRDARVVHRTRHFHHLEGGELAGPAVVIRGIVGHAIGLALSTEDRGLLPPPQAL